MLFSVCVMFAAMAALVEAQCPQDDFSTRNAYEVATDAAGFDITLWNRAGRNLIGTIGGTLDATAGTTTVAGTATATSNDVFQNLASLDDLIENGPQTFLLLGDVDLSNVQDAHGCFLEIGDISSPGGLCMTKEGCVNFPNQFAITPAQHSAGSTTASGTAIALLVTRKASADESRIELDFEVNTNNIEVERFDRPAVAWDLAGGVTLRAPDDEDPMTTSELVFTELLVLEGRNIDASAAAAAYASASGRTGAKPQCLFKEYSTSAVPAVPGSGDNNLELTLTITNFGPALEAERTGAVEYAQVDNTGACDGELMISNFTAISTVGVTFDATTFNGASQQATFAALEVGASQSFTFTATLFSNAPTTVDPPLSVPSIVIDGEIAEIYVQRRANLVFVVDDQRRFDLKNLPIAAGCDVPFVYTIDVFNEGPSCVEDLQITSDIDVVQNCAGDADAGVVTQGDIVIERIEPDTLADTDPFEFSISADADARNAQLLDRSLHLESPLDGGITAADREEPIDSAADVTERADSTLLALNYDVTRYADVKLDVSLVTGTEVTAGAFAGGNPNIFAMGTVTNVGCVDVTDLTIDITVDLPAGGFLARADVATSHTAAGGDAASITADVNAFLAAASGDAGASLGSFPSNMLRINWDGGAPFDMPADFFGGNPVKRGLRFKSPTSRLLSSNAAGTDDDKFDSLAPTIAADFQAFSGERIFISDETNVLNVIFVVPGTETKAVVDSFAAVFVDVDVAGETKLEYYAPDEMLIGTTVVPASNSGLSFAGAELKNIARVKITLGTQKLVGPDSESLTRDVVALDDFFYSRPAAVAQSLFTDGQSQHRRVLSTLPIPSLPVGDTFQQPFAVFVCHQAGAEKAGVRVIAEVGRAGDNQADQHQLETATPDDDTCGRVELVRKFDDRVDVAYAINNQAAVDVNVECEQRLIASSHLDAALDSDGDAKSESSSSSSSSHSYSSSSSSSSSSYSHSSSTSVGDIDLIKVTRCTVSASNNGPSDVPIKVEIDYVLPSGSRLAAFETSSGQFANGVWALRAPTANSGATAAVCNARNGETETLTIDFASTSPGTIQFGARALATNERTEFVGASLGEFKSISV